MIERLREHLLKPPEAPAAPPDDFDQMSDDELRLSVIGRGLDDVGNRADLLERLREDIRYMHELETAVAPDDASGHRTILEALEEAARRGGVASQEILQNLKDQSTAEPKHIDVTVRSLGMEAEKHTAGGAPSVTADVLRGLAGDPFEDPPRYGTVRKHPAGGWLVGWLVGWLTRTRRRQDTLCGRSAGVVPDHSAVVVVIVVVVAVASQVSGHSPFDVCILTFRCLLFVFLVGI